MKQKRYWLRGGIIGVLFSIIPPFAMFIPVLMCGFIGFDGLFENTFICPYFVPETGGFSPPIVVGIISVLITFGIGSFFGWIYGKIKSQNQSGAIMK